MTIRNIRESLHLTQVEMAKRLGITRNYLALIETGRRPLPEKIKETAADLCNNVTEIDDVSEEPHGKQALSELIDKVASLDARLATIEQLLLKLLAEPRGK